MTALLEVEDLKKYFVAERSVFGRPTAHVKAVDGVSFKVERGKTLGLVGESGCGKSTVSRLVLRLIEADSGRISFEGRDLRALGANELRGFRREAQIIFQDPYASLNPRMTVSQILNLLRDLQGQLGLAYVFVSHDLAVVKHIADRVAVMNLGEIVETAETQTLFATPRHPYSRALLSAIPMPNPRTKRSPLLLQGEMPSALNPPSGCRFHTRCPYVIDRCRIERPRLVDDAAGHATACHRADELPPADASLSDVHFSPALERLVAAFSARAEGPACSGVDIVGTTPTWV